MICVYFEKSAYCSQKFHAYWLFLRIFRYGSASFRFSSNVGNAAVFKRNIPVLIGSDCYPIRTLAILLILMLFYNFPTYLMASKVPNLILNLPIVFPNSSSYINVFKNWSCPFFGLVCRSRCPSL